MYKKPNIKQLRRVPSSAKRNRKSKMIKIYAVSCSHSSSVHEENKSEVKKKSSKNKKEIRFVFLDVHILVLLHKQHIHNLQKSRERKNFASGTIHLSRSSTTSIRLNLTYLQTATMSTFYSNRPFYVSKSIHNIFFSSADKESRRKKVVSIWMGKQFGRNCEWSKKGERKVCRTVCKSCFYASLCGCAWKNQRGHLKTSSNVLYGLLKRETRSKY